MLRTKNKHGMDLRVCHVTTFSSNLIIHKELYVNYGISALHAFFLVQISATMVGLALLFTLLQVRNTRIFYLIFF
jgi:putative effector of murein hydrolase LrgA (UPF0299 family)